MLFPAQKPSVRRGLLGLFISVFVVILCSAIGFSFMNEQRAMTKQQAIFSASGPALTSGLRVDITVAQVDIQNAQLSLSVEFSNISSNTKIAQNSSTVIIQGEAVVLPAKVPFRSVQLVVGTGETDTNSYPFDRHEARITVFSSTTQVAVFVGGQTQGWQVSDAAVVSGDYGTATIGVRRSTTSIFFSMFIAAGMWLLSLSAFVVAAAVMTTRGAVQGPVVCVVASLLFALPAIRATQPGVPQFGCTVDLAGFMWNMSLVLVATVGLLVTTAQQRWSHAL